jgi:hypothetical protein
VVVALSATTSISSTDFAVAAFSELTDSNFTSALKSAVTSIDMVATVSAVPATRNPSNTPSFVPSATPVLNPTIFPVPQPSMAPVAPSPLSTISAGAGTEEDSNGADTASFGLFAIGGGVSVLALLGCLCMVRHRARAANAESISTAGEGELDLDLKDANAKKNSGFSSSLLPGKSLEPPKASRSTHAAGALSADTAVGRTGITTLGTGDFGTDKLFDLLDDNNDGVLSRDDVVSNAAKLGLTMVAAEKIFKDLDTNKDGELNRQEISVVESSIEMVSAAARRTSNTFSQASDSTFGIFDVSEPDPPSSNVLERKRKSQRKQAVEL